MAEVKILEVGGHKDWTGDYGTFRIYDVQYESGLSGALAGQIKRKVDSPAPSPGETFEATIIEKSGYPSELKRVQQGGGPGGGGWKPKSPEEQQAINRAVAQKNAILLLGVEVQAGKQFTESEPASKLLTPRIDFLYRDLEKAAGRDS